jgi:hypothetical protein
MTAALIPKALLCDQHFLLCRCRNYDRAIEQHLSQLVQAMATYSAKDPGFDPTSSDMPVLPNDTGLQNAVAAAWHA